VDARDSPRSRETVKICTLTPIPLGEELLRDAFLRTLAAADIGGLRAVVVDAKDAAAKRFYEKFNLEPFADNPFRLSLILKDIRATLRG
jgi:hypothetical protein